MTHYLTRLNREGRIALLLFLILLVCYSYVFPRWADWNQNSRLNLVMAVVDKGVLHIDDYHQNTEDKFYLEGHHYSTKAPGSAFLGIPVYWVFRQLTSGALLDTLVSFSSSNAAVQGTLREDGSGVLPDKLYTLLALYVVTFFTVSIPSALLGVAFYLLLGYMTESLSQRVWLTLVYGLATIAMPYSGTFIGHQIVAAFLFFAFYLLFRQTRQKTESPALLLLAGFLMSYGVITEYPTAIIAGGIFLYGLYQLPRKTSGLYLIGGGIPPIILWVIYNQLIFNKPIAFGYSVENAFDENQVGFFSLVYPHWDAIWGITFGSYRGLFFLSPVLLLAIPGFYYFAKQRSFRAEFILCLYVVLTFFMFNSSSVMWSGGFSVGPRYIIPMLPFLALPIIFFTNTWGQSGWGRALQTILTVWSTSFVWAETLGGQSFPDYTRNPLFNYSLPYLAEGNIARNLGTILGLPGWLSLLPLWLILGLLFALLFTQLLQPDLSIKMLWPHRNRILPTGDKG